MDKSETIITYASVIAIAISLFFIGTKITGFAVTDNETAVVNVTITSSGALNFTTALYDFSSGAVDGGASGATLYTNGTTIDGSWAQSADNLTLENIGNVNVSLTLSINNSVESFIGTGATFKAKVTNTTGNDGACTGGGNFTTYTNITQSLQIACSNFGYEPDVDEIEIEFELYVPNDASGAKTVGIVAIGTY